MKNGWEVLAQERERTIRNNSEPEAVSPAEAANEEEGLVLDWRQRDRPLA
jgi:hypothetical protein